MLSEAPWPLQTGGGGFVVSFASSSSVVMAMYVICSGSGDVERETGAEIAAGDWSGSVWQFDERSQSHLPLFSKTTTEVRECANCVESESAWYTVPRGPKQLFLFKVCIHQTSSLENCSVSGGRPWRSESASGDGRRSGSVVLPQRLQRFWGSQILTKTRVISVYQLSECYHLGGMWRRRLIGRHSF